MKNPIKLFWSWITGFIITENQQLEDTIIQKDEEISKLNIVIEKLKIRKDLDFPKSYGQIKLNEVFSLLSKVSSQVYISDDFLDLTTQTEASKFSEETAVMYRTWVSEQHDCDNFSFALNGYWSDGLKSFAFGIAWSQIHAFNIMVDKDLEIWIVEPQTNKWTLLEEVTDSKYKDIKLIVM